MNKKIMMGIIALATLSLASCSKDETIESMPQADAIEFGTYLGRNVQSRASVVTTDVLKTDGFSVSAFYTAGDNWATWTGDKTAPNFMNNTKVTYATDKWEYTPKKYWPNNEGDKISFFAYAPHGAATLNTTDGSTIDFTVAQDVTDQIDLIWNYTSFVDQTKPTTTATIDFKFAHALARIGFQVAAATDEVALGSNKLDANTKIELKKIVLAGAEYSDATGATNTGAFYTNGTLNLNNTVNTAAAWSNTLGAQIFTLTTDNFVGNTVVELNSTNSNVYQPVTDTDDSYIMVIPQKFDSTNKLYVYVEYDVITTDPATGAPDSSTITNKINTPVEIEFKNGKAYSFKLLLGMTSVKVTADVDTWPTPEEDVKVDLPQNS